MRKRVYISVAAVACLGLILAIVLVSGVVKLGGTTECSKGGSPPGSSPIAGGKETTLTHAQSVARFPVLMPDVHAARLSNLSKTWVNDQRWVVLEFAGGKVTVMQAPANYSSAIKEFQRFVAHSHVTAAIGHVHRDPALVIEPHTDGCGSNPAWVEFDHNGIDINVYSGSYGTDTLLAVADSLRRRTP
jgi:hypothetical protein